MFSAHCPHHGRQVLIPTSRIEAVDAVDGAHLVRWRCTCGTRSTTRVVRPELPI
jgi:hypothetical protein